MQFAVFSDFVSSFRVKPDNSILHVDFETLGYTTMMETGNFEATKSICACWIQKLEDALSPERSRMVKEMKRYQDQALALQSFLYERLVPVSDASMLTKKKKVITYLFGSSFLAVIAIASNTGTAYLGGAPLLMSLVLGTILCAVSGFVGHLFFEKALARSPQLVALLLTMSFALIIGAIVELGRARSVALEAANADDAPTASFVNDPVDAGTQEANSQGPTMEHKARQHIGNASFLAMLANDLGFALVLGLLFQIMHDEDYGAWFHLKRLLDKVAGLELLLNELGSFVERSKKSCAAGILKAQHTRPRKHPPFHRLAILLLVGIAIQSAKAQEIKREEFILIDVSGSIGQAGNDFCQSYLSGVRRLLETEPPQTRVHALVISVDSFGGVRELLSGWTPNVNGVFAENLNRARRQLVGSFQLRSSSYSASANGTDIIGGLWHVKTLLDSDSTGHSAIEREIWIFSDMVNETATFSMPQLMDAGASGMLEHVRNGSLVPLSGYNIHVIGASTQGMSPDVWNITRTFWQSYFRAAGAELVSYSAETTVSR